MFFYISISYVLGVKNIKQVLEFFVGCSAKKILIYLFICCFGFQVLGIICIACGSGTYYAGGTWFVFVAIVAFIMSMIWSLIYLFSIREALNLPINWLLTVSFQKLRINFCCIHMRNKIFLCKHENMITFR